VTSEVVVMNRMGIALAADSVVTASAGSVYKHHDSVVKLFMLSEYHPVGIMVYNNASLLGVPWETIIKLFRKNLGNRNFDDLEGFGREIISFLNNNQNLFPENVQEKYFLINFEIECHKILEDARELFNLVPLSDLSEEEAREQMRATIIREAIKDRVTMWEARDDANEFSDELVRGFTSKMSGEIHSVIMEIISDWPADTNDIRLLYRLAQLLILKDFPILETYTGLVIGGFGQNEHFPVVQHITISGIYGGVLKFRVSASQEISDDSPSYIESFADTQTVDGFLYGVNESILEEIERAEIIIREAPVEVLEAIEDITDERKTELINIVKSASKQEADEFHDRIKLSRLKRFYGILGVVETLPLKELAKVASTLVSLSSFDKQLSLETETVGEPIDVAVISKGDGFIWINRKHYFKADLNHRYFEKFRHDTSDPERKNDEDTQIRNPKSSKENEC